MLAGPLTHLPSLQVGTDLWSPSMFSKREPGSPRRWKGREGRRLSGSLGGLVMVCPA